VKKELKNLAVDLFDIQAVRFGDFTLKSGVHSPIYVDLRAISSYPELVKRIGSHLWQMASELTFDQICGVPYTALPLAAYIMLEHEIPMLIRRKEAKEHGTRKMIEGLYKVGDTCLIVEDVVSSGSSVLETIDPILKQGLMVTDTIAVLDRQQGGRANLRERGISLHTLFTLTDFVHVLHSEGKIPDDTYQSISIYLNELNRISP
jgi:uridine monophosphate synthetase